MSSRKVGAIFFTAKTAKKPYLPHIMNVQLLRKLVETQAKHGKLLEAVRNFREKREAVENSQSDAFNHQSKRVQRRQKELQEARNKLYEFIE